MRSARRAARTVTHGYRDDLAFIHDAGFGQLATSAAGVLVEELRRSGVRDGLVVDLGCGSGILAGLLHDAGHRVVGIDLSEALVEIARTRVPDAEFRVGSFVTAEIPACVAVTAIGEVLGYAFDDANSASSRAALFGRIHDALAPGGVLLFDMAAPARAPADGPRRMSAEGPDWAVLAEADGDPARAWLTRRITTFRRVGELYRRDAETHRLQLVEPADVTAALERVGFSVEVRSAYGSLALPEGLVGFLARTAA